MPPIPSHTFSLRRALRTLWLLCLACLAWAAAPAQAQAQDLPTLLGEPVTQVSTESSTTCALTQSGAVYCWGWNGGGHLGIGTSDAAAHPLPMAVKGVGGSGTLTGVVAIGANINHVCALTQAGGVLCWGTGYGATPVAVPGVGGSGTLSGVAAIAVAGSHTCALTQAGGVLCWGGNGYGQLGDGTTTGRNTPAPVQGLDTGVASIAAGEMHACALTTAGAVQCWGRNDYGQLGDNTTAQHLTPVPVQGLDSGVAGISASAFHTCAVLQAGTAQCWGRNNNGQLGNGSTTQSLTPVAVQGAGGNGNLSGLAAISAGATSTCALTTAGAAYCWGRNGYGLVGDGSTTQSTTPVLVQGLSAAAAAISASALHTCALTTAGAVQCWGSNNSGRLGNGTTADSTAPTATAAPLAAPVAAHAGVFPTGRNSINCALTTAGAAYCWGPNYTGQLGDGTITDRTAPTPVRGLGWGVTTIASSIYHTCAVQAGAAYCWGLNDNGQLGDGTTIERRVPVPVQGLGANVTAIAAGYDHTCAVQAGGVHCWGSNTLGRLGDTTTTPSPSPVAVSGVGGSGTLTGVTAIAAGSGHTCALTTAGAVYCWGPNDFGRLGNGTFIHSSSPVAVSGVGGSGTLTGVTAIAAGIASTCAVQAGAVLCWGFNGNGELGNGELSTTTHYTTPVAVLGVGGNGTLTGITAIAAGTYHTCALATAGAAYCWGNNSVGQFGNPTPPQLQPVAVQGLGTGVTAIAAGNYHTCAVQAGVVRCKGSATNVLSPVSLLQGQALAFTPGSAAAPLHTAAAGQPITLDTGTPGTTYGTWTPGTCTVNGSTLTPTGAAGSLCGVWAAHAGSHPGTAPAPTQMRLLQITQAAPALALTGAASSTLGQSVTFTATLTGGASPTGSITLTAGGAQVCTITLPGSTCAAALPVGAHSITASYAGDASNAAATSNPLAHTVAQAQPTLVLTGPASSTLGQAVTFTATLTDSFNPTGSITLTAGATPVCTIALPANTSTGTCAATLPLGAHSVVANFAGDTGNAAATSNTLAHQVNPVPVSGQCGSAHGGTTLLPSAPSGASLCGAGSASSVTGSASAWGWTCSASTTATCQAPRGYTVGTSAGANGSIGAAQTVAYGATAQITVTPAADYVVDAVTGCGGSLSGNTFTTAPVTAACAVSATFKAARTTLTVPEGPLVGAPMTLEPQPANGWQIAQASTQTAASVGAALPAGVTLPHGVVRLRLEQGTPGSSATVVLTYPQALAPGARYYKYGKTRDNPTRHWYEFAGARIDGRTVTLTLQDGGAGDDDLAEDGVIQDPGGVALLAAAPAGAQAIPTLGEWALAAMAALLGLLGLRRLRARSASSA